LNKRLRHVWGFAVAHVLAMLGSTMVEADLAGFTGVEGTSALKNAPAMVSPKRFMLLKAAWRWVFS
jgi:hypothetical protein